MSDATPTLDTPAIHPTYVRLMCMLMRSQGMDVDAALAQAQLGSWKEMVLREAFVSQRSVNSLIHSAMGRAAGASIGLQLGSTLQISTHGSLGYAMIASKDLRQALQTAVRYVPLRNAVLRFQLHERKGGASFEIIERLDMGLSREFVHCVVFAMFLKLIDAVVGLPLRSLKVSLPFAEPVWRPDIERMFQGDLRFGAERLAFHIPHELLDQTCLTADSGAYERACLECELLQSKAAQTQSIAQRVRELMQGREGQYPSLGDAARYFNMSSSTFIRRLKDEGTSFQTLLDDTRRARAHWYLTQTQLPVEEIAERLGYIDTTNFSRTFRRWHGTTPSELRKRSV